MVGEISYRGYVVALTTSYFGRYAWYHPEYDGTEDERYGTENTIDECIEMIDECIEGCG